MKQFDTKIFHFGGLNWCQQQVSLSTTEIWQPLSLFSLKNGPKNKTCLPKNKV
jgi:hypothetical protein